MYEEGKGISQDYTIAMKWYQDSADRDDADAQNHITVLYAQGKEMPADKDQAKQCYQRVCYNSNQRSCNAYSKLTINQ